MTTMGISHYKIHQLNHATHDNGNISYNRAELYNPQWEWNSNPHWEYLINIVALKEYLTIKHINGIIQPTMGLKYTNGIMQPIMGIPYKHSGIIQPIMGMSHHKTH